jgi:hypothetical protein
MKAYAAGQGRQIEDTNVVTAMAWSEPSRDVRIAGGQAVDLVGSGKLFCVWTGRTLSVDISDRWPT